MYIFSKILYTNTLQKLTLKNHVLQNRICMHVMLLQILQYLWKITRFFFCISFIKSTNKKCFDSRIQIWWEVYMSLQNTCLFPIDISTRQLQFYTNIELKGLTIDYFVHREMNLKIRIAHFMKGSSRNESKKPNRTLYERLS